MALIEIDGLPYLLIAWVDLSMAIYVSHNKRIWKMALIEIDCLPINSMVIVHGYVSHNQMVIRINHGA